jgi:hypothetical protein
MRPLAARSLSLLSGILILVSSLGLFFGLPAFRNLWIWPGAPPLGLAFAGSWFAGVAVPLIWIGLSGHLAAIRAGALSGVLAFGGSAALLWSRHDLPDRERFLPFAVIFGVGTLFALAGLAWSTRLPDLQNREIPPAIRWAFLVFSAILLPVGLGMAMGSGRIFPVPLSPDMERLYGWFFLGSFAYYFYGFLRPNWLNAAGHMLSFLVYDLLLIPPFLFYWPVVPHEFRLNLLVYLLVMVASLLFCAYFLFLDPRTRLFRNRQNLPPHPLTD